MTINYEKQTLDNPNPIARYAHRARFSRSKEIVLTFLHEGATLIDYGCGQGRFLHEINNEIKKQGKVCELYGYDPYMAAKFDGYKVLSDTNQMKDGSANIITCLEVCEHLNEAETRDFVDFAKKKLDNGGILIVTVPIMIGPAILMKELSRSLLFRRLPDIRFRDLLLASMLGVVPPRAENIKKSHQGYNWQVTLRTLQQEFPMERIEFCPIRFLGWYGNSQALMLFKKFQQVEAIGTR